MLFQNLALSYKNEESISPPLEPGRACACLDKQNVAEVMLCDY